MNIDDISQETFL